MKIIYAFFVATAASAQKCVAFSALGQPHRFDADIASMEADVIWSLRSCETLDHVHDILEFSLWANPSVSNAQRSIQQSNSKPETRVGPNVAAAALHKTVDLICFSEIDIESGSTLAMLLENVGTAVVTAPNTTTNLTVYALSDVLISLGKLAGGYNPKLKPLASKVCDLIDDQQERYIKAVGPKRLVQSLETMASLRLMSDCSDFVQTACDRLGRGDSLGALKAYDLSRILNVCSRLDQHPVSPIPFMRRLRKKSVREHAANSDMFRALVATKVLSSNATSKMREEARVMCFTVLRDLADRQESPLTTRQMTKALDIAQSLGINTTEPILAQLCHNTCASTIASKDRVTLTDVKRILSCLLRLDLVSQPNSVGRLGERFRKLVCAGEEQMEPRRVAEILLFAALLHPDNEVIMTPYVRAARVLFAPESNVDHKFLSLCNCVEISRFRYFATQTHWTDHEVLVELAHQLLDSDKCRKCTPTTAGRILTSFTTLAFRDGPDTKKYEQEVEDLLTQLFDKFGAHLWPMEFEPREASAIMFAYARASHVDDMMVFDALAGRVALGLEECTARQVAQSLWACGKMTIFRKQSRRKTLPHYVSCAKEFARYLALQAPTLTTNDVAQSIWTCGRLYIKEPSIVYPLVFRTQELVSSLSSREVANIIWGLARVGYNNKETISELTRQIVSLNPSPQEVSNVLYAMGRMKIGDREVFSRLSAALMEQIQDASAQSIANVLWAYKAVHVTPPTELLDSWATQKLGLVGFVVPPASEDEDIV